jgi:hypothetical protein
MNYCHLLWTILFILGAIPEFCCGSRNSGSGSGSALRRNEFVQAMDRALGKKKNDEKFLSRLGQLAIPANEHPGFVRSQQSKSESKSESESQPILDEQNLNFNNNNRNLEEAYEYGDYTYAVNLTDYALKYVGCSNIKTWSDDLAAGNYNNNNDDGSSNIDSVLRTDRFVVLRLCPRDSCSNYNKYGCTAEFGDYLIPMETYLQVMAETYFAQYQEYCQTCYECMSAAAANNNNNYNNDDGANNNDDDDGANNNDDANDDYNYNNYNNDDAGRRRRRLNDDDAWYNYNNYVNDDASGGDDGNNYNQNYNYNNNANNQDGGCEYYDVCQNYQSACQEYPNLGFDLQDYFECAEFNIGNSAGVGYLGPHCSSDGKTISMGIFSDQYCNQYNGDLSDVSSYMSVDENELQAYYSDNCISCLASDGYVLDANNNDDAYSDISDICGTIYGESAKCNKYMGNAGNYAVSSRVYKQICEIDLTTLQYGSQSVIMVFISCLT